ncbi:hypothetical protein B0H19DRAFT_1257002 [Mycena capillaripes]|nr:hypothetical protein B0H19DRAFT_1257002 [Mycena capillaripes]
MTRTIIIRRDCLLYIPKCSAHDFARSLSQCYLPRRPHKNLATHVSPAFRVEIGDVVTVEHHSFNVLRVSKNKTAATSLASSGYIFQLHTSMQRAAGVEEQGDADCLPTRSNSTMRCPAQLSCQPRPTYRGVHVHPDALIWGWTDQHRRNLEYQERQTTAQSSHPHSPPRASAFGAVLFRLGDCSSTYTYVSHAPAFEAG